MLKKTIMFLGLGSDEDYAQFDEEMRRGQYGADSAEHSGAASGHYAMPPTDRGPGSATVRPINPMPDQNYDSAPAGNVNQGYSGGSARGVQGGVPRGSPESGGSAVRLVDSAPSRPANLEPYAVSPTTFNEVEGLGERYRSGQPVIINLQNADANTQRRVVDFVSGLCFAQHGKMKRVANHVFLITPPDSSSTSEG